MNIMGVSGGYQDFCGFKGKPKEQTPSCGGLMADLEPPLVNQVIWMGNRSRTNSISGFLVKRTRFCLRIFSQSVISIWGERKKAWLNRAFGIAVSSTSCNGEKRNSGRITGRLIGSCNLCLQRDPPPRCFDVAS